MQIIPKCNVIRIKGLAVLPGKLESKPQSHMKVTGFSHVLEYMKLTLFKPNWYFTNYKTIRRLMFSRFFDRPLRYGNANNAKVRCNSHYGDAN